VARGDGGHQVRPRGAPVATVGAARGGAAPAPDGELLRRRRSHRRDIGESHGEALRPGDAVASAAAERDSLAAVIASQDERLGIPIASGLDV